MRFAEVVQTADWKAEKHVPVIAAPDAVKAGEKFVVELSVGKEIAHPNTTEHHIRSIAQFVCISNLTAENSRLKWETSSSALMRSQRMARTRDPYCRNRPHMQC